MVYLKQSMYYPSLKSMYTHYLQYIPPLFFITLFFALGIAGTYNNTHLYLLPALAVCAIVLSQLQKYKCFLYASLYIVSYIAGACNFSYQTHIFASLRNEYIDKNIDISGTIIDICQIDHPLYKHKITLDHTSIKSENNPWEQCPMKIVIFTNKNNNTCVADTICAPNISLKGSITDSFALYLIKENTLANLFLPANSYTLISRPKKSIWRMLHTYKNEIYAQLQKKIKPQTFSLFSSLFLGKKTTLKKSNIEIKELFASWGILHYLARSGLHLVLLSILLVYFFSIVPIHQRYKQYVLYILSSIYFMLTWPSTPFYRAFITLTIHQIYLFFKKQIHPIHTICLVCFLFLMHNPTQLFFLDFQLSFGLTCALILFSHIKKTKIIKSLQIKKQII